MESCSFNAIVGDECGCDPKHRIKSLHNVLLKTSQRNTAEYKRYFSIIGVENEVELILTRSRIFDTVPRNIDSLTMCPYHRASLGVSWKWSSAKCSVPVFLSQHKADVRSKPKADRGLSKAGSKTILKETGVFLPVGSGKLRENCAHWPLISCKYWELSFTFSSFCA